MASNNPFAPPAEHRFPNIGGSGNPWQQQQQQFQPGQAQYQAPMQTGYSTNSYASSGSGSGFQPQTSFGQQLQAQMTGYPGAQAGYQQQQPQQPQQPMYAPQNQQQTYQPQGQPQPAYPVELDPFGAISGGWGDASALQNAMAQQQQLGYPGVQTQPPQVAGNPGASSASTSGQTKAERDKEHPRRYVQDHKAELERWDSYAWKQVHNRLESLRVAWESRKKAAQDAARNPNLHYSERPTYEQAVKDADEKIDSLTAAGMQFTEVVSSYRHSTDQSSRSRVRESLNGALRSIPDWPEDLVVNLPPPQQSQPQQAQYGSQFNQPQQYNQQQQQYGQAPQQMQQYAQPQQQQYAQTGYGQPQGMNMGGQQQMGYQQPMQTGFAQPQYGYGQQQSYGRY